MTDRAFHDASLDLPRYRKAVQESVLLERFPDLPAMLQREARNSTHECRACGTAQAKTASTRCRYCGVGTLVERET